MPEKSKPPVDLLQFLDDDRHQTALRHALHAWAPNSIAEASNFSVEYVARAEALAKVASESESGSIAFSVIRQGTEPIADLLHVAYAPMRDWWDEEA